MSTRTCRNRWEREGRSSGQKRSNREDQSDASTSDPEISTSERDTSINRSRAAETMGKRKRNSTSSSKHHETEHEETKSKYKMNEIKRRNPRTAPQMQAHRMGCTAQNWTLLAQRLSQTI